MHTFFQELKQGSQALGLALSDETLNLLLKYQDALVLWNKAYNLTAIRDPKEMLVKHLLDSLSILKDLPSGRLLDIGTGGGMPGMTGDDGWKDRLARFRRYWHGRLNARDNGSDGPKVLLIPRSAKRYSFGLALVVFRLFPIRKPSEERCSEVLGKTSNCERMPKGR